MMTHEEKKARRKKYSKKYRADVLANPFRHKLMLEYRRKYRQKPGVRERLNALSRAWKNANREKYRQKQRKYFSRMMADPERRAAYLERKRKQRYGADGKLTAVAKLSELRNYLIPRWERVVRDGRDETYMRRASPENERLFRMWRDNHSRFEEMLRAMRKASRRAK